MNFTINVIGIDIFIVINILEWRKHLLITAVLQSTIDLVDSQQRAVTPTRLLAKGGLCPPCGTHPARWAKSWRSKMGTITVKEAEQAAVSLLIKSCFDHVNTALDNKDLFLSGVLSKRLKALFDESSALDIELRALRREADDYV